MLGLEYPVGLKFSLVCNKLIKFVPYKTHSLTILYPLKSESPFQPMVHSSICLLFPMIVTTWNSISLANI